MTTLRSALLLVLDQVDYLAAACMSTEMVGAALPIEIIRIAREALAQDAGEPDAAGYAAGLEAGAVACDERAKILVYDNSSDEWERECESWACALAIRALAAQPPAQRTGGDVRKKNENYTVRL